MKATELGFVVLRLAGLLVLVYGALGIVGSLAFFAYAGTETEDFAWIGIAQILVQLIAVGLAWYLFVHARRVSRLLFGGADELELTESSRSLQAIAFSVVGVVVAIRALPGLGATLAQLLWVSRAGADLERESFFGFGTFSDVLFNLITLALGAFLFFRSTWLADLWSGNRRTSSQAPGD